MQHTWIDPVLLSYPHSHGRVVNVDEDQHALSMLRCDSALARLVPVGGEMDRVWSSNVRTCIQPIARASLAQSQL